MVSTIDVQDVINRSPLSRTRIGVIIPPVVLASIAVTLDLRRTPASRLPAE